MVIPKFDGLRKCRVPFPTGARNAVFEAIATAVAKTNGQICSFA
jgi:hypothetical protein